MVFTVVILIAAAGAMELVSIYRKREWKTLWIYSLLLLIGSGVIIAWMQDIEIPSPYFIITALFHKMSRIIFPTE